MIRCLLVGVAICSIAWLAARSPLSAHPPDADHDHEHEVAAVEGAAALPAALVLPALEGPKPWSEKPLLDDPDRFHIAIMTDNTGGHRPGIWMKAVQRLNLLRPQFVMSVGDLIEGYSENPDEIRSEWKEFLGFIDQMQMKFFFVAGNHDLSNPTMHALWREHFGPEWYSFDYRGVHFVCLNSEDPDDHLGDEQLAWVRKDLEEHRQARWTLLFFHKPMWLTAERATAAGNPDPTNWKQVEEMLGSRPHTVFSGHVHHYVQYDRHGMKYYHLATTGGASQLRGIPFGEFDEVAWLTMEKDGPHLANLLLDGILPPDEVTEQGIARFRSFLAQTRLEVAPILVEAGEGFSEGRIDLRLTNGFDAPVEASGKIDGLPLRGLYVDPAALNLAAAPGQTAELSVNIRFAERIDFEHLASTLLTARLKTVGEERPLTAERSVPVVIDRSFPCRRAAAPLVLDGAPSEGLALDLSTGERPLVLGQAEQWQGPGDASLAFALTHDDQFLAVAARVTDDAVLPADGLELRLDARPIDVRKSDGQVQGKTYVFRVSSPDAAGNTQLEVAGPQPAPEAKAAARRIDGGYELELAVPVALLSQAQGGEWRNFQFTALLADADAADEAPCRIVWRGTADVEQRNTNYGQFVRQ